jgi:DNA-binding transcriptional LysR family regulator
VEPIDLNLLVTLDALLQEGSVTRAAKRVGLSTPAMSHALARLREQTGDPVLVRAGREMVLTPRAEELRARVRTLVNEARGVLSPERQFSKATLERTFVVHATDHTVTVLGTALDRLLADEAPGVGLRFLPTSSEDAAALERGTIDLAIGIYGDISASLRTRQLFTDRFVCLVREGHPKVGAKLNIAEYVALPHVQVAPRGQPGGYVDDVLAERGYSRRVVRTVPYFVAGMLLVAETDYLLTISERVARVLGPRLGLRILPPPLPLKPYALSLLWHPRHDGDPAHRFLRETFVKAAAQAAPEVHQGAQLRLNKPAGKTGRGKRT